MTNQNYQNNQNNNHNNQVNFMDQLYQEIHEAIKAHSDELRTDGQRLIDDIFSVVEPYVKQSWKNGINAGKRQAGQDKQKNQNSAYNKKKAVGGRADEQKEDPNNPWNGNKYRN